MRTQLVGRHVAPEMLALSVVELILTFTLVMISLTPTTASLNLASFNYALMCALTVCFTAFVIGLYRPQIFERAQRLLLSTILSALLSFPAVWIVSKSVGLSGYWPVGYDSLRPAKIVVLWSIGVLCVRLLFLAATRLNLFVYRAAVLGSVQTLENSATLRAGRRGFLEISGVSPERASARSLAGMGIQTLILNSDFESDFNLEIVAEYQRVGIKVQAEPDFWERHLRRVEIATLSDTLVHQLESRGSAYTHAVGRVFDVVVSLTLLIATFPIMGIVALVVRFDSAGSVLYRQERVGLNDGSFTLLKFRSMRSDAEATGPRWAQQRDPRVTRVGMFIRRTRIDELPQLINILRGEMSFIGPRPERPHFVEQLRQIIPRYGERSRVKPGLTGWAQVNYPYGASIEDARAKLSYDLYYVKHRSILLDILILLSTIRVILLQEGAR